MNRDDMKLIEAAQEFIDRAEEREGDGNYNQADYNLRSSIATSLLSIARTLQRIEHEYKTSE